MHVMLLRPHRVIERVDLPRACEAGRCARHQCSARDAYLQRSGIRFPESIGWSRQALLID
ncbi:hypothetical protein X962_3694 [Burkholderia pseudomallei MSHR7343]|nr:hypothetical protein X962_3694 [Burkholderia pseudomallei MSHR7343]